MPCRYFNSPLCLGSSRRKQGKFQHQLPPQFPHHLLLSTCISCFFRCCFHPQLVKGGLIILAGQLWFSPPGTRPNLIESFRSFLLLSPLDIVVLKCSANHTWGLARHPGMGLRRNIVFLAHICALGATTRHPGELLLVVFIFWLNYLCQYFS